MAAEDRRRATIIKPSKKKSTERSDGIVAEIMRLGRALINDEGVHKDRGELRFETVVIFVERG